jgi:hypothetical protein
MAIVELLKSAHISLKKPMHKRGVGRRFAVRCRYQSREEHEAKFFVSYSIYGMVLELDEAVAFIFGTPRILLSPLPMLARRKTL